MICYRKVIQVLVIISSGVSAGTSEQKLDISVQKLENSPGLYYEYCGETQLYNTQWRLVTYINISQLGESFARLTRYVRLTSNLCEKEQLQYRNKTLCSVGVNRIVNKLDSIKQVKDVIVDISSDNHSRRRKRSIFPLNIIGQLSKILFGTLDEEDADYYNAKITKLESEQLEFLRLSKEQILVVKSTLETNNRSINEILQRQTAINERLDKIIEEVNKRNEHVSTVMSNQELRILVNEHLNVLYSEVETLRSQYELILDAILNAVKGIVNPHIVSPKQILHYFKEFQSRHTGEINLPLPTVTGGDSLLLKLMELDVFSKANILCYVIKLPVTDQLKFNIYKLIPLPTKMKTSTNKFVFINPEKEYLLMEQSKQYYAKVNKDGIENCKQVTKDYRACKQTFPLITTYSNEECEAKLLRTISSLPTDCVKHVVELRETLWVQLDDNEWLYVAPSNEKITVICDNADPFDVTISSTGKLKFLKKCKGYGNKVLIVSQNVLSTNASSKDIIPSIGIDIDCCELENQGMSIEEIKPFLPLKPITNRLDDISIASHKISEVEHMIHDQEWKLHNQISLSRVSVITYICIFVLSVILCLYICKKCGCLKCIYNNVSKAWTDDDCCGCRSICFKPTIVNTMDRSADVVYYQRGRRTSRSSNENVVSEQFAIQETTNSKTLPSVRQKNYR